MTPAADGPVTPILCAACGADVLRPDYGDAMFWADPDGCWAVAHTQCLQPYEEALRAALDHNASS